MAHRGRSTSAVLLAAGAAMLCAAPAHAAPTWLPQTSLATGVSEYTPAAAVDAAGDVSVAFADNAQLVVTEHPAGGAWETPIPVGGASNSIETPALASDAAGDTVLGFALGGQVEASVKPAGQPWPSPITASDLGPGATDPSVAVDGRGDALAVWMTSASLNIYTTIMWSYRPAGGSWQPALSLDSQAWSNFAPSVAFTSSGEATVVWSTANGPNDQALVYADLTAGPAPTWTSPLQIATAQVEETGQVAFDSAGDATVAWSDYDSTTKQNDVLTSTRPAGGQWSAPDTLGQGDGLQVSLSVNADGAGAIAWLGADVGVATRPAGGAWTSATVPDSAGARSPEIVIGPDGTATVDFNLHVDTSDTPVEVSQLTPTPGAMWTTPLALTTNQNFVGATVIDPAGDIDILRSVQGSVDQYIYSVTEDAAGPALGGISVPQSGTAGVPIQFSVSPLDAWSAIGETTWNFGDGSTQPDETVSHTYASPGTYTVGISSSDIFGNTSSQSATIDIRPAPASEPPPPAPLTRTPLALSRVTQSHRRWREASHGRALTAALRRTPVGTRFGFTVNQAARVTLTFGQVLPGRRVHRRCEPPSPRNQSDPRCSRTITRGSLTVRMTAAGRRVVRFSGIVGRRHLAAGRYTVTVRATGTGGSAQRRLHFTLA